MSIEPMESLSAKMHRLLSELDGDIDAMRENLRKREEDRELIVKIIRDNRLQKSGPADQERKGQPEGGGGSSQNSSDDHRGAGTMTIKAMAMAVLEEHPEGLGNTGIFEAIQAKFGVEIQPKSLSPQLGRLADKNDIFKENGVWKLAEKSAG